MTLPTGSKAKVWMTLPTGSKAKVWMTLPTGSKAKVDSLLPALFCHLHVTIPESSLIARKRHRIWIALL